jgi:tripartite ATP-independent transporter DctM subunit
MQWWELLLIIFGGMTALFATGMPVAFAFLLINLIGILLLQGGGAAFHNFSLSIYSSVANFALLPVPMFILMGEILWQSRVVFRAIDVLDAMLGRLPGRLSVLTILSGTVFSALSGSTMANTAMLGSILLPEMERRGYHKAMSLGPIMKGGGLAMIIPPSGLAVILATIAGISIAQLLIACIVPGLIMAVLYVGYIVIRCALQPSLTPSYESVRPALLAQLGAFAIYLLPLAVIVFLVTGVIVLGVATPTEGAALGCVGSFMIAAAYRKLSYRVLWAALIGTLRVTVMVLTILIGAQGFSQLLAYSGASRGLLDAVLSIEMAPWTIVLAMMLVVLFLGCFMDQLAIMLITIPIFFPIIVKLGFDPIWFGVLLLINLEMALTTPPFGMLLFVMKGVAPPTTTMRHIYVSAAPFLLWDAVAMTVVAIWPVAALWYKGVLY